MLKRFRTGKFYNGSEILTRATVGLIASFSWKIAMKLLSNNFLARKTCPKSTQAKRSVDSKLLKALNMNQF